MTRTKIRTTKAAVCGLNRGQHDCGELDDCRLQSVDGGGIIIESTAQTTPKGVYTVTSVPYDWLKKFEMVDLRSISNGF